jgi:hypothetical protein
MTETTQQRTLSRAERYLQRQQEGVEWLAPSGLEVLIRDLDISDHAVLGSFPSNLQQMIYRSTERSAALRSDPDDAAGFSPFEGLGGKELLEREYEIGTALCKLGWVDPQVVDEVTDPTTQISVTKVNSRDRRAYMARIFGGQAQEAQQLAGFSGQPHGGVGAGSALPAVQPDAVGTAASGGEGVLGRDSV